MLHDLLPNQSNDFGMTENFKVIECVIFYQATDESNLTLFKERKIISTDLNGTLHKIIRTIRYCMSLMTKLIQGLSVPTLEFLKNLRIKPTMEMDSSLQIAKIVK
jgi:hypothetical protein